MSTVLAEPEAQAEPSLLSDPQQQFRRHYNRSSFMFRHGFKNHPLFALDSLVALSRRLPAHPDFAYWSNGKVGVADPWEKGSDGRYSLQDTIAHIADNNSLVILKHTEQDPLFGPVLREFLGLVVDHTGAQMRDDVIVGEALILISSPNRVTSYHIDAEVNYLVQVSGDKTFNVFPPNDRRLISDEELERFYTGDFNGAVFKPDLTGDARVYDLRAGCGVHIPVTAPHWVQNGDNVSVAISINYELRSVQRLARLYQLNRKLRNAGLTPETPGASAWRDRLKLAAGESLRAVRHPHRPAPPRLDYPVWTPSTRSLDSR